VIPHECEKPTFIVANLIGVTTTVTMTSAEPLVPSDVAVIVADPFDIGVTTPEDATLATPTWDDDQANVFPESVSPLAPRALAVN